MKSNTYSNIEMMYKLITITVLILTSIAISGCKKELGVHLLGDMKQENPYSGDEVLYFLHDDKDTLVFNGGGRESEQYRSYKDDTDRYYINETDHMVFSSHDSIYELSIWMASHYDRGSDMLVSYHDKSSGSGVLCNSISSTIKLPLTDYYTDDRFFIDSLWVNNKYYYEVLHFECHHNSQCNSDVFATSIYYSATHGILILDFSDDTSLELIDINVRE